MVSGGYGLHCQVLVDRSNCIVSHGRYLGGFLHTLGRVLGIVRVIASERVAVGMH
jgi:hypothetical protein